MSYANGKKMRKAARIERLQSQLRFLEEVATRYEKILWLVAIQKNGYGAHIMPLIARETLANVERMVRNRAS